MATVNRTPSSTVNQLLNRGLTHAAIADITGVSRSRITQLANNQGTRKKQNTLTSTQWDELLAQYPEQTITYLANKYNISRAAIYRKLK